MRKKHIGKCTGALWGVIQGWGSHITLILSANIGCERDCQSVRDKHLSEEKVLRVSAKTW